MEPKEILGKEGLLGQLTKRLVERTLEAEMSSHLGYEKGGKSHRKDGNTLWRQEPKDGYQRFGRA